MLSKALAHHPQTNSHNGSNSSDTGYLYFTRAVDVELTVTTLVLYYIVIIILSLYWRQHLKSMVTAVQVSYWVLEGFESQTKSYSHRKIACKMYLFYTPHSDWSCVSVCVFVMDVTSPNCNAYSGSDSAMFTITCTLWEWVSSALILQWPTRSSFSCHSHRYRGATNTGQTTLEQAKAVLSMRQCLLQARLRYKRVHFLGTAKRIWREIRRRRSQTMKML